MRHLVPNWNQQYCLSQADGTFNCIFKQQRSGTYENPVPVSDF